MRSAAASSGATRGSLAWRALGIALFVAYPVTTHLAPPASAVALLAVLLAYVAGTLVTAHPARWLAPLAAASLFFIGVPDAHWVLYVPPVAINLALCWLFGRTLRRPRVPLIARFAMLEQGALSAELEAYTRRLTWIWTALFAGAALASFALALSGNRDAWSAFTNFLNYALVAALFLGEVVYRRVRFRNYRHQSPLQLLRNVRGTKLFER